MSAVVKSGAIKVSCLETFYSSFRKLSNNINLAILFEALLNKLKYIYLGSHKCVQQVNFYTNKNLTKRTHQIGQLILLQTCYQSICFFSGIIDYLDFQCLKLLLLYSFTAISKLVKFSAKLESKISAVNPKRFG
ncbi:hypothetical protein BpHYR1_010623 [Brachionus plicatilis]|uniref:Uncharacterized protein n=1 Tax=Brachionus plicatilis TaxID=10195 RepID=A0A3M7S6J4_BRAPC|nr:hypothetical protein BpHYR1_010623 [Brachionus plicatilis]